MADDKEYQNTIKQICDLLQSEPTPQVVQSLRESFETLGKQLKAGPFLEVFEATLANITFAALFSLLAAPDNRLVAIVSEVTGQLLKPVTWNMVHATFEDYIIQGLDHPHTIVKCLVLEQFLKYEAPTSDPFSPQYAPHIWRCLGSKTDNDATRLARKVLVHLCGIVELNPTEYVITGESVNAVKELLDTANDSQRFRVYDVIATIMQKRPGKAFELFRSEGILDIMLNEGKRHANDPLLMMNFYELIPALCSSAAATEYMEENGVFADVLAQISTQDNDSITESLLRVGGLKLFSRLVDAEGIDPQVFLEKYSVATHLAQLLVAPDANTELLVAAINCTGAIGNNPGALEYLAHEKTALKGLAEAYNRSMGAVRVECLQAIACIFGAQPSTPTTSQACYGLLYAQLADGRFLISVTKEILKGFEESCVAGFAAIQKMALHAWGIHEIAGHQNAVNFLLTRDPSRGKVVQQWQFAAIQAMANAKEAELEFDAEILSRIIKYVNNGPYYVGSAPQVALEST